MMVEMRALIFLLFLGINLVSAIDDDVYPLHNCQIHQNVAKCPSIMTQGTLDMYIDQQIERMIISRIGMGTSINILDFSKTLALVNIINADSEACARVSIPPHIKLIINNQQCPQQITPEQTTSNQEKTTNQETSKNQEPTAWSVTSKPSNHQFRTWYTIKFSKHYETSTTSTTTTRSISWEDLSRNLKIIMICIIVILVLILAILINWASRRIPKRCRPSCYSCCPCGEATIYERRNRTDIIELN